MEPGMKRGGRVALWLALGLFVVFIINVVAGKIAVLGGATTLPGLGDVGEFLVLFVAVLLFIVACLARETAATDSENQNGTNS